MLQRLDEIKKHNNPGSDRAGSKANPHQAFTTQPAEDAALKQPELIARDSVSPAGEEEPSRDADTSQQVIAPSHTLKGRKHRPTELCQVAVKRTPQDLEVAVDVDIGVVKHVPALTNQRILAVLVVLKPSLTHPGSIVVLPAIYLDGDADARDGEVNPPGSLVGEDVVLRAEPGQPSLSIERKKHLSDEALLEAAAELSLLDKALEVPAKRFILKLQQLCLGLRYPGCEVTERLREIGRHPLKQLAHSPS